ncbi:glycosyl transferase [Candidatus Francisella endociliophora]|uniref:Glycosyl transferase n=1 Tax=Candidatus Francisella endociliophora TaxID=653937 RepID=A0A097EN38_9GAMM|nr:glycosyltransferase family 4 protein [Francisella sp. FSC1006]AIT08981.1 glycosyl transferase [Francisella sp. FSC1006]
MKILHVFKSFYPYTYGGIEKFIHELSIAMAKKYDAEIHILAMGKKNETIKKDFYTLHFANTNLNMASTTFSFSAIKTFRELSKQIDIIHYHFPYPFADLLHMICKPKKPYIITYHSDIIKQKKLMMLYKPLMKKFLNGAEVILPTSPNYLESSEALKEIQAPKKVIPMSLNEKDYEIDEKNYQSWKKTIGFEKFFIYIGGLRYYKGLDVLIDAMKEQDYPLVIVGDGNQREYLEQKAKQNNLQNIKFVGALDDKDKLSLLKLSYALVLPSNVRTEAFGLVLLEASIFAKPMITCEIGTGTTFVNIDKQTGLVAKPNDSQDLAKNLKELWQDEQKAQEYGKNARSRFDDIFDLDKMVESYKSVYDEVIESGVK